MQRSLLLGWLNGRAISEPNERRLFSIRELLAEIDVLRESVSLAPGTLKEWRRLWDEVSEAVRARTRVSLGRNGDSLAASRVQPLAQKALASVANRTLLIMGAGGTGKSTLLAQAAEEAALDGADVLYCGANDVTPVELEELFRATSFFASLAELREPNAQVVVVVDALDEAEPSLRKRWAQLLSRLEGLPNVRLLASVRDSNWRSDSEIRGTLSHWHSVSLSLWPEALVRELLGKSPFRELPSNVVELLRIPIMLDIFWRTFVEGSVQDVTRAERLHTRHSLLAAFWHERLLDSPRHSNISDFGSKLLAYISQAALSVEGVTETSDNRDAIQILLSEGVIVREGRLRPRLVFRHPLLRDFAYSQWCLEASDPTEVSGRWLSIAGGLQRHGALKAAFEALSDPNSGAEYPSLALGNLVQSIVGVGSDSSIQLAHVLAAHTPSPGLNPATWSSDLQSILPEEFGRDLLASARFEKNPTWASVLLYWPDTATWLGTDYPRELYEYADSLSKLANARSADAQLVECSRQAATALRRISEAPRFSGQFAENGRWLTHAAMRIVIPQLRDRATLEWVKREIARSTRYVIPFLKEGLFDLAALDAAETASIYRQIVGLSSREGQPIIDPSTWSGIMSQNAIEWSLGGEQGRRSLLSEHPIFFLPVAVDLAEALWHRKRENPHDFEIAVEALIEESDTASIREQYREQERARAGRLADLIDDSPKWRLYESIGMGDPYDRCLKAIKRTASHLLQQRPIDEAHVHALRRSRLASIQMILCDGLLNSLEDPAAVRCLEERLFDSRLYYIRGFAYWIEQGLTAAWSTLSHENRERILALVRELLSDDSRHNDARRFLARLPSEDLPADLLSHLPAAGDPEYQPTERPERIRFDPSPRWTSIEPHEAEPSIGNWPEDCDHETLKEFARSAQKLSKEGLPLEERRRALDRSMKCAEKLLPSLSAHPKMLAARDRFWVWVMLLTSLKSFRKTRASETDLPPADVVSGCVELALWEVEDIPLVMEGSLPDGGAWSGHRESSWEHALKLVDEAMTWPPARDDAEVQSRFRQVMERALAREDPLIYLTCVISVRPWHWFRFPDQRERNIDLIWLQQKQARVLAWAISHLDCWPDAESTKVFRMLLARSDLFRATEVAHSIGSHLGGRSMFVFDEEKRSATADVVWETISTPERFSLLDDDATRSEYFCQLMFGMKEQASLYSTIYPQLASDYGRWSHEIWKVVHSQPRTRKASESILHFALHWLEKRPDSAERDSLKIWWEHLLPLMKEVAAGGSRPDCFILFFNLEGGKYNDLTIPEVLLEIASIFSSRTAEAARTGSIDLDEINQEAEDYNSWRTCAGHAANLIRSLDKDGSLRTELQQETAHHILSLLAAEPVSSPEAREALHHLRN